MASIRQYQRRAIEAVRPAAEQLGLPVGLSTDGFSLEDGQPLYPLGVSPGIGTCADALGMNVLVVSRTPGDPQPNLLLVPCAYAVLLEADPATPRHTVELLRPVRGPEGVRFQHTDARQDYVATIS